MTTTAAKPGVRAREAAYKDTIANLQRELVDLSISMGGLHATLIAVLAQKGGEVTITAGTVEQVNGTKLGFSMTPGPGEGEMTLRVVTEEDAENDLRTAELLAEQDMAEGLQTDPAGEETNGTDTHDHTNDGSDPETGSEV
jgi:hypothetical protein